MEPGRLEVEGAVASIEWASTIHNDTPRSIQLTSEGCLLRPRVQIGRTGDLLVLGSTEEITHNPHGWLEDKTTVFNFTVLGPSYSFKRRLEKPGRYRVDCDTHKWMRAYVQVFDHPFAGLTDENGVTEFPAPAGTRTLRVWHEILGVQELEVEVVEGRTSEVTVTFELADHRDPRWVSPNEKPWSP